MFSKLEKKEELENNRSYLNDKLKSVVQQVISQEMVDKMPIEIRIFAGYFAEFANQYAPDQFFSLVGGFLFLRYINPALTSPATHGLLGEGRTLTTTVQRNLVLITKILQVS